MSLDLKNLELFVRVAALGAIGRAGAEFDLSSTNATQRIKALEGELGVTLFNRTTRSVSLTSDGEIFLDYAKRVLNDLEDARTVLTQTPEQLSGSVRVTAPASFGVSHVAPFVPEFHQLHPNVRIELNLSDTMIDIVEQGYDLAFRIGELAPSSLLAQKIDTNPTWLVAAPAYLARAGAPTVPEDLIHHSCLPLGDRTKWRLRGPDGAEHVVRVGGPLRCNLGNALVDWALQGAGITKVSLWQGASHILAGRLIRVLPDYSDLPEMDLWAVRPPGRLLPVRVKVFLDFIRARVVAKNRETHEACGHVCPD